MGDALKSLRTARGWSLRALAQRSGVSSAMLSDIERGEKSPTVRLAYQIARALECSITDLLGDEAGLEDQGPGAAAGGRPALAGRTRVLDDGTSGIRRVAHRTPLQHGRLDVVVYELAPGASSDEFPPNRDGTIETVAVLDGALELLLDGTATRVERDRCVGHGTGTVVYRNVSASEPCRFLALVDSTRC